MRRLANELLLCIACAAVAGVSATAAPLPTPAASQPGVLIRLALRHHRVTLREPVFAELSVYNGSEQGISFDLGFNREANLQFLILDPEGARLLPPRVRAGGIGRVGKVSLGPGGSFRLRLLVNRWYQFPTPGTYRVQVKIVDFALRTESGRLLSNQAVPLAVSIQVKPRNPQKLSEVCRALEVSAIQSPDYEDKADSAMALSYVADEIAIPYLAGVALNSPGVRQTAVLGLARLANTEGLRRVISQLGTSDPDLVASIDAALRGIRSNARVED